MEEGQGDHERRADSAAGRDAGVVRLTLNRPKAFNSLDRASLDALHAALDGIAAERHGARRRHRRQRQGVLRRARPQGDRPGPHGRGHRRTLQPLLGDDAEAAGAAAAGDRRGRRHRHRGRLPAGRRLRPGDLHRGQPVRHIRHQVRPLLLDADGGFGAQHPAEAGHGDAADRRLHRRRRGASPGPRQPGRRQGSSGRGDPGPLRPPARQAQGRARHGQAGLLPPARHGRRGSLSLYDRGHRRERRRRRLRRGPRGLRRRSVGQAGPS